MKIDIFLPKERFMSSIFLKKETSFRCFILKPVSDVPLVIGFGARLGEEFLSGVNLGIDNKLQQQEKQC
jgi:hypothetical protein